MYFLSIAQHNVQNYGRRCWLFLFLLVSARNPLNSIPGIRVDGLATRESSRKSVFQTDPLVEALLAKRQEEFFSMGLVVGWPPHSSLKPSYDRFISIIQQLVFEEHEETDALQQKSHPSIFFTPFPTLHITVATLMNTTRIKDMNVSIDRLHKDWKHILLEVSKLPEWPVGPLRLRVQSADISTRAGILLWQEETGRLERIRSCLWSFFAPNNHLPEAYGYLREYLAIPKIIHTTFARYYKSPHSSFEDARSRLKKHVLPQMANLFPEPVVVDVIKMADAYIYFQEPAGQDHSTVVSIPLR